MTTLTPAHLEALILAAARAERDGNDLGARLLAEIAEAVAAMGQSGRATWRNSWTGVSPRSAAP